MSEYHEPVLLKESIDRLITNTKGTYVDVTFGGGGHSKEILNRLDSEGKLIVFDQDNEAQENLINDERIFFIDSNFRHIYRFWKWLNIDLVDGILADLGVSSHQFDVDYRGFSYRFDAPLDMRMNEDSSLTAEKVLMTYDAIQLQDVFSRYGEVRNSRKLAQEVVKLKKSGRMLSTSQDLNLLLDSLYVGDKMKYYSQVYQALRIEVNDEMSALGEMLTGGLKILKPGGKFVVISYHSLEDRMVKKFMKSGNIEGKIIKDAYGRVLSDIKMEKKIILPSEEEQNINVRSRSAKMRVGEKL
ncbi:MAG: 16S rRNA (cytosine(1402)-N(4))-methyltransferase RsmH [Saprospiraceae bacterium]|nr:16S rRNA (cytosine(1402)-N(4))-methyltransferase RsmH [Bacteroidia bacterium]NNE13494.1 16S rRNA (cytosine(1402)-N(4))-methyltransferase RsmH [Saprospiraceae bacterium]NNL92340.1 16S rRNA (cytosine(1402)-N(4))-methyltransferase RsmH [Saprospiraceae bacterium]